MPFLATTTASPLIRQVRQRLQEEATAQTRRELIFKIKFSACVLAAVAVGTFLVAAYGLR